jgi:hypothetical protein
MKYLIVLYITGLMISCAQNNNYNMGIYGYDKSFFQENDISFIELTSEDNFSRLLIVPEYQGRVMTSTADGLTGISFGWINYSLIESGKTDPQFNPIGGEERFWIGPEGGPFSIYFKEGDDQIFENWKVPPVIDTESFNVKHVGPQSVTFEKSALLKNASGTEFNIDIERKIALLTRKQISSLLNVEINPKLKIVSYQTDNKITNTGPEAWTTEKGLLSIWLLCMFNPSPSTTVIIPFQTEAEGVIVNDEYFGKVPPDRLIVDDGMIFFKADGMHRSKIGLPPGRASELCGSYNAENKVLTILWYNLPEDRQVYVNSKWGYQDNPYDGDVINSYNDGPLDDGSIMGPFYELETSSPAAALAPLESITHIQSVLHVQGDEKELAFLVKDLFNLELDAITSKF